MTEPAPAPDEVAAALEQLLEQVGGEPVDTAGFAARVAPLGWVPLDDPDMIKTALPLPGVLALTVLRGQVQCGTVNLTSGARPTPERRAWLNDVFAADVHGLTRKWGKPVGSRGDSPEVRWALPGGVVVVRLLPRAVSATVYPSSGYELLREVGLA